MSSTESLLADDKTETTDATTTQEGGTATEDTQATTPEQTQDEKETTEEKADDTTETEAKPDEKKEGAKEEEPKEPEKKAPESYEFSPPEGMPEGFELNKTVSEAYAEVARELDLSQDEAQSVLSKVIPVMHQQELEQMATMECELRKLAEKDDRLAGDDFDKKVGEAMRVIQAFDKNGLHDLLKTAPIGSHPDLLAMAYTFAQFVSEDGFVSGKAGKSVDREDRAAVADRMFNHPTSR